MEWESVDNMGVQEQEGMPAPHCFNRWRDEVAFVREVLMTYGPAYAGGASLQTQRDLFVSFELYKDGVHQQHMYETLRVR
jgi:hypothetical protein